MAANNEMGLIGLAVMGQNLALNIADKGFPIAVYNRTASKVDETLQRAQREGDLPVAGYKDMKSFAEALKKPRRIIILVKAGPAVDETLAALLPFLEKNDIVIDGGNEWYRETERRGALCSSHGIRYVGMGVSGGEEGARHGPSLMPGGSRDSYDVLQNVLTKVAAQVDDGPCVSYVGPGGAGNYVKMVHNGIEYGDMQLIAEAYDVLRRLGGLKNDELYSVFSQWNAGELKSFLIEITADIFKRKDDLGNDPSRYLVDLISDAAGAKGTGKWTIQEAAERAVPCPTIQAAVDMRSLSNLMAVRKAVAAAVPPSEVRAVPSSDKDSLVDNVRQALLCSKICSYAQGLMLLQAASAANGWHLNLGELARTWKGGCIIRASFLDKIKDAFKNNAQLESLLIDPYFADKLRHGESSWRNIVSQAQTHGIPVPALASSLNYFDGLRARMLPTNLIQAQRDYFGAHTFQRTDREGIFHASWSTAP